MARKLSRTLTTEITDKPAVSILSVEQTVERYYPLLLPSVKCALAVLGALAFKDRKKPLSVMFETTSGYGKSAVLQMLYPLPPHEMGKYIYRSDKFTPKSFVSHASNVSRDKLKNVDLLPRLQNKLLVTKELSPLFRGREEEMRENFAILIAVLDGKGFMSDSGVHGQRGYDFDVVFNWLGATTPLPAKTHRMMYQLGTRLLLFETPSQEPTEEELTAYAERDDSANGECECQAVVNAFVIGFFACHPVGSVAPNSVVISSEMARSLTRYAILLSHGRREIKFDSDSFADPEPTFAAKPEGPYKIVNYFKELARAHALIHGRDTVADADLELVASVAVSSIPEHLRPILRELQRQGSATSSHYSTLQGISPPTARRHLKELALTGIGVLKKGNPSTSEPDTLTLEHSFLWLYRTPLKTECGVCVGEEGIGSDREQSAFKLPSDSLANEGGSQGVEGQNHLEARLV